MNTEAIGRRYRELFRPGSEQPSPPKPEPETKSAAEKMCACGRPVVIAFLCRLIASKSGTTSLSSSRKRHYNNQLLTSFYVPAGHEGLLQPCQRSRAMSPWGSLQQINRLPPAGGSTGSGR